MASRAGRWGLSQIQLVRDDGYAQLSIAPDLAAGGESLERRVEDHGAALAGSLPGYVEHSVEAKPTDAGTVVARRFSWGRDRRQRHEQVQLYHGRRVATLTTRGPLADDDVDDAAAALASGGMTAREYSPDELAAIAELFGLRSFPGTGGHELASERERVAARRVLAARGILRVDADSRLRLADPDAHAFTTVLRAQHVVSIERRAAAPVERRLLYVDGDRVVLHEPAALGLHRLVDARGDVADAVVRLTRLRSTDAAAEDPIRVSARGFELVRDGGSPSGSGEIRLQGLVSGLESSSAVTLVTGRGGGSDAGSLVWYDAGQRGLWVVTPGPDQVTLSPIGGDEIRSRLEVLLARVG